MDGRRSATATSSSIEGIPAASSSTSNSSDAVVTRDRRRSRQRHHDGGGTSTAGDGIHQHEIERWIATGKKSSQVIKEQEADAQHLLTMNSMNRLRDLQKEIEQTNWMFDA